MSDNNGWLPIETAPKDGLEFLIFVPAWVDPDDGWETPLFHEVCTRWDDGSIVGCRTHCEYRNATHWQPLPPPPETHTREA